MYQLLSGKTTKLRLVCIWVKCGFSYAATSAFYTFKIRRSTRPQIRILPPARVMSSVSNYFPQKNYYS